MYGLSCQFLDFLQVLHGQFLTNLPILAFRVVLGPRYVDAESPIDDLLLSHRSLHQDRGFGASENPHLWRLGSCRDVVRDAVVPKPERTP